MIDLNIKPDDEVTAKWANALVAEIAKLKSAVNVASGNGPLFVHPFRVTAERDPRDSNTEGRAWEVRTALGSVNDTPAAIVYRNTGDSRDWTAKPVPGTTFDALGLTDRTALELDSPPYHLLTAPRVGAPVTASDDFVSVPDNVRPSFFRTAAMWEKRLFQASVTLTNSPGSAASPSLPAILLSRLPRLFRLVAGHKPVTADAFAGGNLEVATLYLLRDDTATDPFSDTIVVRQRVFWNVASVFSQPTNALDGADVDPLEQIIAGSVGADLEAAATVSFWTV